MNRSRVGGYSISSLFVVFVLLFIFFSFLFLNLGRLSGRLTGTAASRPRTAAAMFSTWLDLVNSFTSADWVSQTVCRCRDSASETRSVMRKKQLCAEGGKKKKLVVSPGTETWSSLWTICLDACVFLSMNANAVQSVNSAGNRATFTSCVCTINAKSAAIGNQPLTGWWPHLQSGVGSAS